MMRRLLRLLPNLSKICTAWLHIRRRWAAVYRSKKGTRVQSMSTTACKGTEALRMPIYKAVLCMLGEILLIQCQLRALCSTLVTFLILHPPAWTTVVPLRFRAITIMDRVTPTPHIQTLALTTLLREGCRKRRNLLICKDFTCVCPSDESLFITS